MTGGSLTAARFATGSGGVGNFNLSGGILATTHGGQFSFVVGENANGMGTVVVFNAATALNVGGELFVGQGGGRNGTLNINSGNVSVNSWIAVGRGSGTGTVNLSGGTFTRRSAGNGQFILGDGNGSAGTWNQTGGTLDLQGGTEMWIGSGTGATGAMVISAGTRWV